MGVRSLSTSLLLIVWGIIAWPGPSDVWAVTRPQKPNPLKIWISVEQEREAQFRESIRKLRVQHDKLSRVLEQLEDQGLEMDDPRVFMIYRELRDLRRRIYRLERDRFR